MGTEHPTPRWWSVVRSVVTAAVAVAALVAFLAWMGGAFHEKTRPDEVPAARPSAAGRTLVSVERVRGEETATAVGAVQPRKKTDVASQLLATVLDVKVRPGGRVKAGDPLIDLDDRELLAQRREATAGLAVAEADLVTRRADYERLKKLRDGGGGISNEEFDRVEGAFRVAEAQVTRAKEVIGRLTVTLSHTRIAATAAGLVADRFVEPGDLATPGKPLLAIYDPADLELHAQVPETLAPAAPVGAELAVRVDAAGLNGRGAVREVVPQAQQASRSVLVKVTLPAASAKPLLPGMFGRVEIPVGSADRLWVPTAAVRHVGQLDLVEVANPDGTLTRRFVRVGHEAGGKVEILSGLAADERVALPADDPRTR